MRIALGTDEKTELTGVVVSALADLGHEVLVVAEGDPWSDVGEMLA